MTQVQIEGVRMATYWAKPYPVDAVRLRVENMRAIADYLGGLVREDLDTLDPSCRLYIDFAGDHGFEGDWAYCLDGDWSFLHDDEFQKMYQTHSQRLTDDEKYAKIFQLVTFAMQRQDKATFNQNGIGEMDLVAIETTQRILGEL